jgi:hypothetical protein
LCAQALLFPLLRFKPNLTTVSAKKVILFIDYLNYQLSHYELNLSHLLLVFFCIMKVNFLQIVVETNVGTTVTEGLKSHGFCDSVLSLFAVI